MKNIVSYANNTTGFNGTDSTKKHTLNMSKELMKQICHRYYDEFGELAKLSRSLESESESNSVNVERYANRNGFVSALQRRVKAGKMNVETQHELLEKLN